MDSLLEHGPRWLRNARVQRAFLRIVPWASLALSVAGAVWMTRDEDAAALVAVAVAGCALTMSVLLWMRRNRRAGEPAGVLVRIADFAGIAVTQSLVQLPLFFSAPFYLLAFADTFAQVAYLTLFAIVAVVVTWDPLAERVLLDRWLGTLMLGFSAFAGLRVALPMLGLAERWTLLGSLMAVGAMATADVHLRWPDISVGRRFAGALTLSLALGLMSPAMPAAPLRLVASGIGTDVQARRLLGQSTRFDAGARLYCWTAIFSPQESHRTITHRWSRDGEPLAELELRVDGGRERGFRTWSRLHAPHAGEYRCEVLTRVGQRLGAETVQVR